MTTRSLFSAAEWALLGDAPLAAAAAVALAEEGGGAHETMAMIVGWREARQLFPESLLIQALVADLDPEDRGTSEVSGMPAQRVTPPSPDDILDEALDLCEDAAQILRARMPRELAAYAQFVLHVASRVAGATDEGDAARVSRRERTTLRALAEAFD